MNDPTAQRPNLAFFSFFELINGIDSNETKNFIEQGTTDEKHQTVTTEKKYCYSADVIKYSILYSAEKKRI